MYSFYMAEKKPGTLHIGTSGWMYKDWGELFYPSTLKKGHLSFLAQTFKTVEINSSFYHLPLKSTFEKWADEVPDDFRFAVKISKFITHQKKLKSVRTPLELFVKRAAPMQEKLGVILVQLPPSLAFDMALIENFVEDILVVTQRNYPIRFALEVRHKSWIEEGQYPQVIELLRKSGIALVFAQSGKMVSVPPEKKYVTSNFVYLRFHGPHAFAASRYGARLLKPWALRVEEWLKEGLDVFVYFNNDIQGHAIYDAKTFTLQLKKFL